MKKIPFIIFIISSFSAWGQATDITPQPAFENRELPRTLIISYNSEEAALEGSLAESLYLQPLSEGWEYVESRTGSTADFTNRFKMPFAWADRQVFVYIGSASGPYEVWVNDKKVGFNTSSSTPAEFDITHFAEEGIMNRLQIRILRGDAGKLGQGTSGSNTISGDVYVHAQPRVRIRDFVHSVGFEGSEANLQLGVAMKSHLLNPKTVRLFYSLLSPDGDEVSNGYKDVEFSLKQEDTVRFFIKVRNAKTWTPSDPKLYTLTLKTRHEGRFTEFFSYRIGFRTVEMRSGELYLNSYPSTLSVASYAGRSDRPTTRQTLERLKSEGYNMVKLTGTPQQYYFYELCDQLGIYVCDQTDINTEKYGVGMVGRVNPVNDPSRTEEFLDRVTTTYYTSRNHPSVIMYSIAQNSFNGYNLYECYLKLKEIEKERPIIYTDGDGEWNTDAVTSSMDRELDSRGERIVFDVGHKDLGAEEVPFAVSDLGNGLYNVTNTSDASLRGRLVYTVTQGKKTVSSGSVSFDLAGGTSAQVAIPNPAGRGKKPLFYQVKAEGGL